MTLDLKKEKGREILYRLVENADVFIHNLRQDVPERLGADYETLRGITQSSYMLQPQVSAQREQIADDLPLILWA